MQGLLVEASGIRGTMVLALMCETALPVRISDLLDLTYLCLIDTRLLQTHCAAYSIGPMLIIVIYYGDRGAASCARPLH